MQKDYSSGTVAVVGLGTMGRKIAAMCLENDLNVLMLSRTPESGKAALDRIMVDMKRKVDKGKITLDRLASMTSRMHLVGGPRDLKTASLIIEAVTEDTGIKKTVYRSIEPYVSKKAVLATNTSSLPITELGSAT
jgi:3-hydroxyacyl-CoA dehydrogenase